MPGGKIINTVHIRKIVAAAALGTALLCTAGAAVSTGMEAKAAETPEPSVSAHITGRTGSAAGTGGSTESAADKHESAVNKLLGPSQPRLNEEERSGIINILLIGTDERLDGSDDQGRGDVTMLCSLDKSRGTVKLVSFERSTAVQWPGHGDVMLTNAYSYGGAELTMNAVRDCFRVDIAGYVHFDFDSFKDVIDAVGGVDIELTKAEADALTEDTYTEIWFSEGMNHLDGDGALRYCRLRRIDDNWQRVQRQRNTVQAILTRTKKLSLSRISELAETMLPLIDTDLTGRQLASLLLAAPKFAGAQAEQMTIPDRNNIWTYDGTDESVTGCDYRAESERLHEFIYGSEGSQ